MLFNEVIQTYLERKDWFLELMLQHITLALIAIALSGVLGLLAGIWIAEHERMSARSWGSPTYFTRFLRSRCWVC